MYERGSFLKNINFRLIVVPILFIGLILLSFIPIWTAVGFCPNFFIMMLYLWLIYRPDLIQFGGLFIVSLIQDGLYGYPLGISILEIIPLLLFTKISRLMILQYSFNCIFGGYIIYLSIYSGVKWIILSAAKQQWLHFSPIFQVIIFSILIYPIMCQISLYLQKYVNRH